MSDDRGTVVSLPQRSQIAGQEGARVNNLGQALQPRPEDYGDAEIVIQAMDGVTIAIGDGNLGAPAIRESREPPPFNENLALTLVNENQLSSIGSEIIQGVDADIASRQSWIDQYTKGIDLLGLKIEDLANRGNRRNVSRAGDPLLIEAMVKYQALALDTPIPTPDGWTTVGDVAVGDYVFDELGRPARVIGLSDIETDKPCLRVSFDDGLSITTDAEHLWTVEEKVGRNMKRTVWQKRELHSRELNPLLHAIWLSKPLDLPTKELPIDPYILGVWLGDGRTDDGRITIGFADFDATTANLSACGVAWKEVVGNGHSALVTIDGFAGALRATGLAGNKHIPVDYMRSCRAQREALLQGLMDTDGHINKITRQCCFGNNNFELIAQIQELLKTLSIKSTILCTPAATRTFPDGRTRACAHSYQLRFTADCDRQIFRLPRKREIHEAPNPTHARRTKMIKITDVREVRSVPVRCLAVDTENHLFLAGLGMVPTHNSGAEGEMLPAAGPAKVMTIGKVPQEEKQLADAFEADFNYFLTEVAKEYYPDTSRMLMHQAFCGIGYKKVYRCPIRRRPVSESVLAPDLIVSEEATDLDNALRVTHRIDMMKSQLQRMQIVGQYREIGLGSPGTMMGIGQAAQRKIKESEGISIIGFGRPEDQPYEILECDTMLDIDHHVIDGHYERKTMDGMLLPYKVAVERNSQQVLGMWRNWDPDDKLCLKRNMYVKFGMVPGLGYHDWGFLQLLGNQTRALRAIMRLMIDSGMFGNFPGGIKASKARTATNEIAPGPGEWVDVDTTPGMKVSDLFMAMPYKPLDPMFVQVAADLRQRSQQLAGSALTDVGEGRANVPTGTIMAFLEDKVQVMAAVYKRNHLAQKSELRKLRELFAENPEDLWLLTRDRPRDPDEIPHQWERKEEFEDLSLMPASDPNIPSRLHRLQVDNVMAMLAQQAPQYSNIPAILQEIYRDLGKDPDQFVLNPQQGGPPPPDPKVVAANIKAQSDGLKVQTEAATAADRIQLEKEQLSVEAAKAASSDATTRQVAQTKAATDTAAPYHAASAEHLAPQPPVPVVP